MDYEKITMLAIKAIAGTIVSVAAIVALTQCHMLEQERIKEYQTMCLEKGWVISGWTNKCVPPNSPSDNKV